MKIKSTIYKKHKQLFIIFILILSNSCKTPLSPQEIFNKYKNSVVLITTEYYYELDLGNGYKFWLNGGGQTFDTEEEANKNRVVIQGTGFFISQNGHLATNRHVVAPEINSEKLLDTIENECIRKKAENNPKIEELDKKIDFWSSGPYVFHTKEESDQKANDFIVERQTLVNEILYCNFDKSNAKVLIKSKIHMTYNGSNLSESNSFQECSVYRVSSNANVDLAVIQLNSKSTSSENIFQYETSEENDSEPLKVQSEVYMISYNLGSELGQTANGLSVQFNEGKIMQDTDNQRLVYTIPALHGSSGSPVLDKFGNLVAINFAGIQNTQSFNFGIPVQYLKMLMNNTSF